MNGLTVHNPWILVLLPFLPAAVWLLPLHGKIPVRRRVRVALTRGLFVLFCVLAFAGVSVSVKTKSLLRVLVIDVSDSYKPSYSNAVAAAKKYVDALGADDSAAVVFSGARAVVAVPVKPKAGVRIPDAPPVDSDMGSSTDLGAGIRRGLEICRSGGSAAEIVLFSDGRSNRGGVRAALVAAKAAGVPVHTVAVPGAADDLVSIQDVAVPETVLPGERFSADLSLRSSGEIPVRIYVTSSRDMKRVRIIKLNAGDSSVRIQLQLDSPGAHVLTFRCVAAGREDGFTANNMLRKAVRVTGRPRVMWISSGVTAAFGACRGIDAYDCFAGGAENIRSENPDVVVMENVPASAFAAGAMDALTEFTRRGGGVVVLGGPEAYGPGGYGGTKMEKLLPVWPEPKKRRPVSMAVLLDASGSMGEEIAGGKTKYEAALMALLPLVSEMKEKDSLAIITFNVEPFLQRKLAPLEDGEAVKKLVREKILAQAPGGGTDIYPALRAALDELSGASEGLRHVILFSDGKTRRGTADVEAFRKDKISISSIAADANPDKAVLRDLAESTGGRFYSISELEKTLKDVFLRDLRNLPDTLFREKETALNVSRASKFKEIGAVPALNGFALTSPKEDTVVDVKAESGEPVVARRRFGAGRVTAFTGALGGKWGKDFTAWPGLGTFLAALIDSALPEIRGTGKVRLERDGGRLVVTYAAPVAGEAELAADVVYPEGGRKAVRLGMSAPGEFSASVPLGAEGYYTVAVRDESGSLSDAPAGYYYDLSGEKRRIGVDGAALSEMSNLTGGRTLGSGDAPPDASGKGSYKDYDLWRLFVLLAGVLFLTELAAAAFAKVTPS